MYSSRPLVVTFRTSDDQTLFYGKELLTTLCPVTEDVLDVPFTQAEMRSFLRMIDHKMEAYTLQDLHNAARVAVHLKMRGEYPRHPAFWFHYFRDNLFRPLVLSLYEPSVDENNEPVINQNIALKTMWDLQPTETEYALMEVRIMRLLKQGKDINRDMGMSYDLIWPHFSKWCERLLERYQ